MIYLRFILNVLGILGHKPTITSVKIKKGPEPEF